MPIQAAFWQLSCYGQDFTPKIIKILNAYIIYLFGADQWKTKQVLKFKQLKYRVLFE